MFTLVSLTPVWTWRFFFSFLPLAFSVPSGRLPLCRRSVKPLTKKSKPATATLKISFSVHLDLHQPVFQALGFAAVVEVGFLFAVEKRFDMGGIDSILGDQNILDRFHPFLGQPQIVFFTADAAGIAAQGD